MKVKQYSNDQNTYQKGSTINLIKQKKLMSSKNVYLKVSHQNGKNKKGYIQSKEIIRHHFVNQYNGCGYLEAKWKNKG